MTAGATRAEVCVVACAEAWRGDGEILASPIGTVPAVGARLARATFSPELMLSDGESQLIAGTWAVGSTPPADAVESWLPFRSMFDLLWSGRRHVTMVPSQVDLYGNSNISCIGDYDHPTRQLLGVRGAPGNTINHATSYWVPRHSRRSFVGAVDMVSGVGNDRAHALGAAGRFVDLRRVVSNLAVFDFATPDGRMRLVSVHPGVTVDEVLEATGFEPALADDVRETRLPSDDELELIRTVIDPTSARDTEVAA